MRARALNNISSPGGVAKKYVNSPGRIVLTFGAPDRCMVSPAAFLIVRRILLTFGTFDRYVVLPAAFLTWPRPETSRNVTWIHQAALCSPSALLIVTWSYLQNF